MGQVYFAIIIYKKEQFEPLIDALKGNNLGIYMSTSKEWETIYRD